MNTLSNGSRTLSSVRDDILELATHLKQNKISRHCAADKLIELEAELHREFVLRPGVTNGPAAQARALRVVTAYRKYPDDTQRKLATRLGFTQGYVSRVLKNAREVLKHAHTG